jgi:hypothetical protein
MSPQALHLSPADIHANCDFIIFSPDHGFVSEHVSEDDARVAFDHYLADFECGDFLPFLLRREGEDWNFA